MDSFGLDFGSNDILDLGSLGMWGGTTPVGSSPSGTGLPFSVGTPTGVPSLGDDSFPTLQGGNEDFIFPDSPKANAMEGQTSKGTDKHASSTNTQTSSSIAHANSSKNGNKNNLPSNTLSESASLPTSDKNTILGSQFESSNSKSDKEDQQNEDNEDDENEDDEEFNASSYFGDDFDQENSSSPQSKRSESNLNQESTKSSHEREENSRRNSNSSSEHSLSNTSSPKDHSSSRKYAKSSVNYDNNNAHGSLSQRELSEEAKGSSMMVSGEAFESNPMLHSSNSVGLSMSLPIDHGNLHPLTPNRSLPQTSLGGSTTSVSSAARPHIEGVSMSMSSGHLNLNHQASMARYPQTGPMMMSQGQVPSAMGGNQGYAGPGYSHSIPMPSPAQGVPPGQYMQAPPSFRPPSASSYDEDLMRMKSMMLQHSDLIPPPMEVLRISMSQSQPTQQNVLGGTYMPQRNVGPNPGARSNSPYPQYPPGNPGMMIQQTTPTNAVDRAQLMQRRMPRTPSNTSLLDASSPWQSETDLPLRRKMIGKIVSLLQARKPDAPPEWIRRLPDMARRLEDSLYRTAKNRDEYGDFGTLKTRLQHLAVTMGAKAQRKAGTNRPSGSAPAGSGMMHPGNAPVNSLSMPGIVSSSGHMLTGMSPYNNIAGRMTQQQLLQQQHMTQMQNSQMRQQMTPQQLQQFQVAQMRRSRQYQQQLQQQHAQNIQRQSPYQHPTQQMQQHVQMQRQAPTRQPSTGAPNANQRGPSQSYMQQSHQSAPAAQTPMQYRNTSSGTSNRSNEMNFGEASEFLNLELSQSFLSAEDLGSEHTNSEAGHKRSLTHAQQQMAAAANAAAFKRTKVSGTPDQRGMSPISSSPPSGNPLQKPGQSGSNKTPPMSAVNAK